MTKVIDSSFVATMIPNTQGMWKVERQPWVPAQPEHVTLASAPPESCYDRALGLVVDPGLYRNPAFQKSAFKPVPDQNRPRGLDWAELDWVELGWSELGWAGLG